MAKVFVFGSNLEGQHGGGAAAFAVRRHRAKMGVAEGRTGNAYAIPTMDYRRRIGDFTLPLEEIAGYAKTFIAYVKAHPKDVFLMTAIGCGIAGLTPEQVAPLFAAAPANVLMPRPWHLTLFGKVVPERQSFDQ
jgi:hypothetical protein